MNSKISQEQLTNAVSEIFLRAKLNKRKFIESIDLQIGLKNYNPKKDKRFSGTIILPHVPKSAKKVAILGDAIHLKEAGNHFIDGYSVDEMKKFNKKKKPIKKFLKKYDYFFASDSIIKTIPRILGPELNKLGKFPSVLLHTDDITNKISNIKSSVKLELKKTLCLGVLVGNVGMGENEVIQNLSIVINFLISLLKKNWQNVKSLYIKTTMGKPVKLY